MTLLSQTVVTERWNRVVAVPYMVYMPERQRLLMLVSCDYPHQAMVITSDDLGRTWTDPRFVESDAIRNPNDSNPVAHRLGVSLTYMGAGRVMMHVGDLRYLSSDFGDTWPESWPIPPSSVGQPWHQWDPCLVDTDPHTGRVIRLAETGYVCAGDCPSGGASHAEIRFSTDLGRTWTAPHAVPQWQGLNEVALFRAANGDIVAAARTENPERFKDEIDHYEGLAVSISTDNGATWSAQNRLYEFGRHHPCMISLADGTIVMTYVVRRGYPDAPTGMPQFGVEAIVSRDYGRTWDIDGRIVLGHWVGNRNDANSWWASSQSTSSILLPDGTTLTAYGTGYRSQPDSRGLPAPRDVALVHWTL